MKDPSAGCIDFKLHVLFRMFSISFHISLHGYSLLTPRIPHIHETFTGKTLIEFCACFFQPCKGHQTGSGVETLHRIFFFIF